MSTDNPLKPTMARKLGIGLAAVGVPVIAAVAVWELKQQDDSNNDDLERGFRYDDTALRQVDPALIGWTEAGQIPAQISKPTCIAVSEDGNIAVAGEQVAKVLDGKGREVMNVAIDGTATSVALSITGVLYVAVKDHIEVHEPDGTKQVWPTVSAGAHITSISLGTKAMYVADSGLRVGRVLALDYSGKVIAELAKADQKAGIPGISTPSPHMDVAVTPDGNVWVANPGHHQLELYSPAGELLKSFGQSGTNIDQFLGCCNPSDFALLSDGRIVTAEKGVPRIKVFKDDGHMVNVVVPPTAFGGNRAGIDLAADSAGRVLVLEPGTSTIRVFAEKKV